MPRHWPPFFIGLLMLAYWASVIVMVVKTKKEVGKAANFLPPEPIGRLLRILWYPLVLIWIVHPITFGFARRDVQKLAWVVRPVVLVHLYASIPMAIAVAAFLATLVCWRKMGKSWRMGIDPNETTELIVQGPYAYVRHPISTLSLLLMICTMLILPTPLMLIAGMLHIFFLVWEARREETYLCHVHGEPYARYCTNVGRFMPKSPASR
ncbi:hypothetical protein BH10PLA1_BH10PLA1_18520 [soil metagenome]